MDEFRCGMLVYMFCNRHFSVVYIIERFFTE